MTLRFTKSSGSEKASILAARRELYARKQCNLDVGREVGSSPGRKSLAAILLFFALLVCFSWTKPRTNIPDDTLERFETSLDLFGYIREYIPWHNPGSLIEEEYWQLNAYLIRENGINRNSVLPDGTSAELIFLHENNILAEPKATVLRDEYLKGSDGTWFWTISVVLLGTRSLMA